MEDNCELAVYWFHHLRGLDGIERDRSPLRVHILSLLQIIQNGLVQTYSLHHRLAVVGVENIVLDHKENIEEHANASQTKLDQIALQSRPLIYL